MWVKLNACVLVCEWLFGRSVNQQASEFFTYYAMAHRQLQGWGEEAEYQKRVARSDTRSLPRLFRQPLAALRRPCRARLDRNRRTRTSKNSNWAICNIGVGDVCGRAIGIEWNISGEVDA
jgi:hypothetical protein